MTSTTTALRPSLLMATVLLALATATHAAAPTQAQPPRPAAAKPAPKPKGQESHGLYTANPSGGLLGVKSQGTNVAVGDVNGDGAPGATSRTTSPGGVRGKEFTGPICSETACGCNGGCTTDPKKPGQTPGTGGAATPNMSLNFEEVKATVKAPDTNTAQMGNQSSSRTTAK